MLQRQSSLTLGLLIFLVACTGGEKALTPASAPSPSASVVNSDRVRTPISADPAGAQPSPVLIPVETLKPSPAAQGPNEVPAPGVAVPEPVPPRAIPVFEEEEVPPRIAKTREKRLTDLESSDGLLLDVPTLRAKLLSGNVQIFYGQNNVGRAKDALNIARTRLLPSLNIGVGLDSLSAPGFLLGSVSMLLPFLVPENWFELYRQKQLYQADQAGFRLVKLNQMAQAWAVQASIVSDLQILAILEEEVAVADELLGIVEGNNRSGDASDDDLSSARAEASLARVRLRRARELLVEELGQIRKALGLKYNARLRFPRAAVPASHLEDLGRASAVSRALKRSVEMSQAWYLEEASKQDRWKKVFGWLTGASLASEASLDLRDPQRGHARAFDVITGSLGLNFGFDRIPSIQLAEKNVREVQLRQYEIELEVGRLVDSGLGRLEESVARFQHASNAEREQQKVLDIALARYRYGTISLTEVLEKSRRLREARLERLGARAALDQLRITLHRIDATNEFSNIGGCSDIDTSQARGTWALATRQPKKFCGLETIEARKDQGRMIWE